jgi:hypothetical protein
LLPGWKINRRKKEKNLSKGLPATVIKYNICVYGFFSIPMENAHTYS